MLDLLWDIVTTGAKAVVFLVVGYFVLLWVTAAVGRALARMFKS